MKNKIVCAFILLAGHFLLTSCDNYFDVDVDSSKVLNERVYGDDVNATAAVNGIYQSMVASTFAGGGSSGIASLTGLSSDELYNIMANESYVVFQENRLLADNSIVLSLWKGAYTIIYQANDVIEELDKTTSLSDSVKTQLTGEALFARAFCNFYLVNLFGGIPIANSSDYRVNATLTRSSPAVAYAQIISDLIRAQSLLKDNYIDVSRTRPSKLAATALLARAYLFTGDWENAIVQATNVIDNPQLELITEMTDVFKMGSRETIWQLASEPGVNTLDASVFILEGTPGSGNQAVSESLLSAFEADDQRRNAWVGTFIDETNGAILYYPYKYKAPYYSDPSEHYVVFRLAEQLLIRSEAYAHAGNFDVAVDDLNAIRVRAGLSEVELDGSNSSLETFLPLIEQERRIELFSEWGHRWLDLKRTGSASEVLGTKPDWTDDDMLYPVPQEEFRKNPKLGLQNDGY